MKSAQTTTVIFDNDEKRAHWFAVGSASVEPPKMPPLPCLRG